MKILIVNKYLYQKGGSEVYVFSLADLLKSNGHSINFFGLYNEKNIVDGESFLINAKDISDYNFWDKLKAPFILIYSRKARKVFSKALNYYKPDIIHLNNFNYQITPSILFEAKRRGIKVVLTAHDPQIICPNHRLYIPSNNRICEDCMGGRLYKCITNRCFDRSLFKSLIGMVESFIYKKLDVYRKYIDLVIAPSKFLMDKFYEFGFYHDNIKVMHNFVTGGPDIREITSIKENYILYFGRISKEKGLETLIGAMKLLRNEAIPLKLVGDGPLKEALVSEVRLHNLNSIEFAGYKTGSELADLIKNARFAVYPSEWYENCPMSIIEAFSLGTPVIGSNLGGIPELIDDGVTGYLFSAGDSVELAAKIKELYYDTEKISEFSYNAYNKFQSHYTDKIYYQKLLAEYESLLNA